MTQEDKELLLTDLCARLPYGVKLYNKQTGFTVPLSEFSSFPKETPIDLFKRLVNDGWIPYLQPMSSTTEEEKREYYIIYDSSLADGTLYKVINWLNLHHIDYRRLIEKGLALPAPEGMYKEK